MRDDYDVLQGTHEIAITSGLGSHPANQKLKLGKKEYGPRSEYGVNQRADHFANTETCRDLEKDRAYWGEVRKAWAEVFEKNDNTG